AQRLQEAQKDSGQSFNNYNDCNLLDVLTDLLKKSFALKYKNEESYDIYLSLIYGLEYDENSDEKSDSSISDDNEIPSSSS
ncbi:6138_t:CDS:2, partial [Scutellospora calospora]